MSSNIPEPGSTISGRRIVPVFLLAVLLLTLGFYRNQWQAAGRKWFYDWKVSSDVMLVARLVWSRQAGVWADGALLGLGDGQWPMNAELGAHQYDAYLNNGQFRTYWTYNSVIGAQGSVFSLIDRFTGFASGLDLKLFRGLTALLSAIMIALIAAWFWNEFGGLPALLVLVFCLFSEWLTLYAGSLYWQLWAFYVPAAGVALYLHRVRTIEGSSFLPLMVTAMLTVLVKTLFNGFEFITAALGMMFVPVVYYAVLRGWSMKACLAAVSPVALGAAAGTLAGLAILTAQISSVLGGWGPAVEYLAVTFGKRAAGDPAQYSGLIAESLRADVWSVVWHYISQGRAIDLDFDVMGGQPEIQYGQLFILFAAFGLAFVLFSRLDRISSLYHKTRALLHATWFSMLPPLSWLVLFKAHSYIHVNLNYIIWQMPFTLFGCALCGMVIRYLFSLRRAEAKAPAHGL